MREQGPRVRLDTPFGSFTVEVDLAAAPLTSAHFLAFAREGHFARSTVYRIVTAANCEREPAIEVIQFGWYPRSHDDRPPLSPVPHESTNQTGLRHRDGTVSLARIEPGSGTSAFFVALGDQPQLDKGGTRAADAQGFAAFGRVVDGRETLAVLVEQAAASDGLRRPSRSALTRWASTRHRTRDRTPSLAGFARNRRASIWAASDVCDPSVRSVEQRRPARADTGVGENDSSGKDAIEQELTVASCRRLERCVASRFQSGRGAAW